MFSLQQPSETFLEDAAYRFSFKLRLRGDAATVFDVIADGGHEAEWFPDFKSLEWETPQPHGVGSIRRYHLTYMTLVEHFVTWEPQRELRFWVSEWSIPLLRQFAEYYRIERADSGFVTLHWDVCYEPLTLLKPLHPLVRPFFAKDFRKAASNLEKYCERLAASPADSS